MNILYITTIGNTMGFFTSIIEELLKSGHTVDVATNLNIGKLPVCYREWNCKIFPLSCTRSPFNKGTLTAIKEIRAIVANGNYDVVHCHTPIAAMCTRFACRPLRKKGVKVFYTAHGFHFYKGAPLKNWLLYYPVEWLCAHWTDTLIAINREDYAFAQKHLPAKRVVYTHGGGGGVGLRSFQPAVLTEQERTEIRTDLGLQPDDVMLINVGELSHRKNQEALIRSMHILNDPKLHLYICGSGSYRERYEALIGELGLERNVHLLGHRSDVSRLYVCADIFVFPSYQEGLSAALLEAMACGLPAVCSAIRGNVDLIEDGNGGCLHAPEDVNAIVDGIQKLADDASLRRSFGERNRIEVQQYGPDVLIPEVIALYEEN